MPDWLWFGSFVYTALLVAFICTATREDDDRRLAGRTAVFFAWIAGGTAAFCGLVAAVGKFL